MLLALSGCASIPQTECEIEAEIGVEIEQGKPAKTAGSIKSSCSFAALGANRTLFDQVATSLFAFAGQSLNQIDFSAISVKLTGANSYIPNQQSTVLITLYNQNTLLASHSFPVTVLSGVAKITRPADAQAWASAYEGLVDRFDSEIVQLEQASGTGQVSLTATARYGSSDVASATDHVIVTDPNCGELLCQTPGNPGGPIIRLYFAHSAQRGFIRNALEITAEMALYTAHNYGYHMHLYRIRRAFTFSLFSFLLCGCASLIDGLAKPGPRYMAYTLTPTLRYGISQHTGKEWRMIRFCQQFSLTAAQPLQMQFDCILDQTTIDAYQKAAGFIHPLVADRLRHSLTNNFIDFAKPLCVFVVHPESRYLRFENAADCLTFYLPAKQPNKPLADLQQLEQRLAAFNLLGVTNSFYHEAFHLTYPIGKGNAHPYHDRWVNEFLAYQLANIVQLYQFELIDDDIVLELPTLETPPEPTAKWLTQCSSQPAPSVLNEYSPKQSSNRAMLLSYWQRLDVAAESSMIPFYAAAMLKHFKGQDSNTVLRWVPRCNPKRNSEVFAVQQQLLDYDFAMLATRQTAETAPPQAVFPTLLKDLWLAIWRDGVVQADPFLPCRSSTDAVLVRQSCISLVLDYLWLQGAPHSFLNTASSKADVSIPNVELQQRYQAWLTDQQLTRQTQMPTQNVQYQLDIDGYFSSNGVVADTGAAMNIWPAEPTAPCELSGNLTVRRLNGQEQVASRCRLDAEYGVIWQFAGHTTKVVGIPQLLRQQATLVRDLNYHRQQPVALPYVYQHGLVVFQQVENHRRLNICLDTGSPRSYMTQRYRQRHGLTPSRLATKIEAETRNGNTSSGINISLLQQQVTVALLPDGLYPHCDLLMGADLLGLYDAIKLKSKQLILWRTADNTLNHPPRI